MRLDVKIELLGRLRPRPESKSPVRPGRGARVEFWFKSCLGNMNLTFRDEPPVPPKEARLDTNLLEMVVTGALSSCLLEISYIWWTKELNTLVE